MKKLLLILLTVPCLSFIDMNTVKEKYNSVPKDSRAYVDFMFDKSEKEAKQKYPNSAFMRSAYISMDMWEFSKERDE